MKRCETCGHPLEAPSDASAVELFEYWKIQTGHPGASPKGRVEKVKARLRDGFTPEQIRQAIAYVGRYRYVTVSGRAAKGTPGERFDDLELICRNPIKLERFIDLGEDHDDGLNRKLVGE